MAIGPMVVLTTAANPFAARVLAAHLGAEGIVWELRGEAGVLGTGGQVDVLVAESDLVEARLVVAEQREHHGEAEIPPGVAGVARHAARTRWLALCVAGVAVALLLGRLLVLDWG